MFSADTAIPQIDVAVNAPMSGKITELLVEEDSTVTVGQDLLKMEPGEGGDESGDSAPKAAPEGGARSEPKEPEEGNKEDAAPEAQKEKGASEEAKEKHEEGAKGKSEESSTKPTSSPPKPPAKQEKPSTPPKKDSKSKEEPKKERAIGSRNETRVSQSLLHSSDQSR